MKPSNRGGARRKSRKVKPGKTGLAQARRRAWRASIALERSAEAQGFALGLVCAERRAVEEEATLKFQETYRPRYPCRVSNERPSLMNGTR